MANYAPADVAVLHRRAARSLRHLRHLRRRYQVLRRFLASTRLSLFPPS